MESSLRARLRSGDPEAFGRIFDDHARAVHRYAVRVTGNWATAEDIVSLTFLEAWRLREKVRPEGEELLPWLLGIATNVPRNTARAARRHQAAISRLPLRDTLPDFADEVGLPRQGHVAQRSLAVSRPRRAPNGPHRPRTAPPRVPRRRHRRAGNRGSTAWYPGISSVAR